MSIQVQLLKYQGTGNHSGTLDTTGDDTIALGEGLWKIWADVPFFAQVNTSSGAGFGANPTAWPDSHVLEVVIPGDKTFYLAIKSIALTGNYYANKVTLGEV